MLDDKEKKIRKLMIVLSSWFNNFIVILLTGFIGGASYQCLYSWIKPINVPNDAVSVANTYIVFTTIIFVIATIVLAVAGYYFSLKFSESQEAQEMRIADNLIKNAQEQLGIKLVEVILENSDVKRMIDDHIKSKAVEVLKEIADDELSTGKQRMDQAQQSINKASTANKWAEKIKNGGKES